MNVDEVANAAVQSAIEHEYKPFEKAVKDYCTEHDLQQVERIKLPNDFYKYSHEKQNETIVEAIKKNYPDRIEEKIFRFPHQFFYFITDKNFFFTLHSKARPFSEKEIAKIDRLREQLKTVEVTPFFQKAKENFDNAKSFYDDGMKELARMIFQADKYADILTSYKETKKEIEEMIENLLKTCRKEKYFTIAPHELNRQVKIYIASNQISTFEKLGYKVIEHYRKEKTKKWNNEFLNWDYEETERKHFYVQMSSKVFLSACRHQRMLYCGKYYDEQGNEIQMTKGRTKGCNNQHLNKPIVLMNTETWEELQFETQNDLAKHFKIDKGNLSRKLKGREIGDCVKFNKVKYIIKNLTQTAHKSLANDTYSIPVAQRAN